MIKIFKENIVLIKVIGLMCILFYSNSTARAQTIENSFLNAAITKLENSKIYTLEVAALMPENLYSFKPVAEEMSFGEQLLHLSSNLGWLSASYLGKELSPVTKADAALVEKKEIILVLQKAYAFALATLKNVKPDQLTDSVKFFAGPMNKLQIINLLSDHQTHHRAQMLVYLRLNGIKPPAYVGW